MNDKEKLIKKLNKLFLALHNFHNFRESHINSCELCKSYYTLYNLIMNDINLNFKI